MRAARALVSLDEVELGDHVCCLTDRYASFAEDARAYAADGALYGDKIVVVGPLGAQGGTAGTGLLPETAVLLDFPGGVDSASLLSAVRREARTAAHEGFRSVRVLTERVPATAPGAADELLAQELELDEFASETGAIVVCAFRRSQWDALTLEHVASVHPHEVGMRAERPTFRMFSTGTGRWSVDGVIDSQGASAFNAALRAAMRSAPAVTLEFEKLAMIDAAGMHALVDAARHVPDGRIRVEGANELVRLCWELAGYATDGVPVVMAA
ncbi:hypothetical protein EIZ62_16890 [Streptomyces ficellus]|uniref:STAS domain-containing protein n=1 Tax=Streptomyces ficellus TaxID=1977088 RepID=A0A6I6FXE9_9ACTN|nr:hypothetical protein EIZ62_16890 [Streptomyces ficellus]